MKDLTTDKGKAAEIKKIENSFLAAFRKNGIDLNEDVICNLNRYSIKLGLVNSSKSILTSSLIEITAKQESNSLGVVIRDNLISFGSFGSFCPKDEAQCWQVLTAAACLQKWAAVCEIVNIHCRLYYELEKEIISANILK